MRAILIAILTLLCSTNATAQGEDIVFGQKFSITSTVLNEQRQIAVFTPGNYQKSDDKYQVLYLLDGEWNFLFVSSLVDKLSSSGDVPPMLVVGVLNSNRNKDLTPPGINDDKRRYGGGERFLQFLTDELQPWVDNNYRTHPYKVLAGHSFGGLFTVYSSMQDPEAFNAYLALSPSLGRNNEQQIRNARDFFTSDKVLPQSLFIAVGNEGGLTYSSSKKFAKIIEERIHGEMRFRFSHLKAESHVSITTQGFIDGLKFIYDGINPDRVGSLEEIFQMEAHFQSLSERFGYRIAVPEEYYQRFVKEQIAERELDYALFILAKYQKEYPGSLHLLSFYTDVYLLQGDFEKAKKYYLQLKSAGVEEERIEIILDRLQP